ncbi:IS701 family transposase [Streptomyces sp. NPDC051243]|uniref:IS701 family transposase n=1 Tax=Streptomyces sp. NPDC051243 TaxID=3365646 RepID=UPI0037B96DBE
MATLISHRFARAEPRRRVVAYMEGLLSHSLRKNAFALASHAREVGPDGMQRLLRTAKWDADEVRDDLLAYVLRHTRVEGGDQPGHGDGVLVAAQEAFVKKGRHSAGVTWQYSSRHRRMENCQIGLFLTHVSARGSGVLDRELYLPQEWLRDRPQVIASGLRQQASYASKARLTQRMIARALDGGLPRPWISVPERDLWDEELRLWLDGRGLPHALRLAPEEAASLLPRGMTGVLGATGPGRAPGSSSGLNTLPWQTVRLPGTAPGGRAQWLLVHHSAAAGRPEGYLCSGPPATTVAEFIRAVRAQTRARHCLDVLRNEVGLDEYQVRTVTGWYRHTTLSLLAYAFRSFALEGRVREPARTPGRAAFGQRARRAPRPGRTPLTSVGLRP